MKTLEEKARAYDKALERARKLYNSEETSADVEIACENIFPELAESEDERMKKAIMHILYENYTDAAVIEGVEIAEIVAWLEKQGQVKESPILQQENKTCCKNGNSLTCMNDTLLDLLHKMPSCITINERNYQFVLRKTTDDYIACYEGEEDSGKAIFWMAGEPIELLTEMLEKLKEKGLL